MELPVIWLLCLVTKVSVVAASKYHGHIAKRESSSSHECLAGMKTYKNGTKPLIDPYTRKCYAFGTQGPCGKNMIFYEHPAYSRSSIGFCDCDQGFRHKSSCSDFPVRRMVYNHEEEQCFPIFSQGPCQTGYWLNVRTENNQTECQPNPCAYKLKTSSRNTNSRFWFWDPLRKSCFQAQTRGYCPVGLTLEVIHDSHIPKCRRKRCFSTFSKFRSALKCRAGSRYSYFLRGCLISKKVNVSFLR